MYKNDSASEMNNDGLDALRPESVDVSGVDIRGTVFIIPLDAPVPNELQDIAVPKGGLYERLSPLVTELEGEFAFCALAGNELYALDRVWRMLVTAKKVAILTDLPGARYDIIFTQAMKQIGIRSMDWPVVAESIASRSREVQRTTDKSPWLLEQSRESAAGPARRRMGNTNVADSDRMIPAPSDDTIDENS